MMRRNPARNARGLRRGAWLALLLLLPLIAGAMIPIASDGETGPDHTTADACRRGMVSLAHA